MVRSHRNTTRVSYRELCLEDRNHTVLQKINPLTPNDRYRGRTAPLTSEVTFYIFIQQI